MTKNDNKVNIEKVRDTNLCILCGTCVSTCSSGAITIPFNGEYKLEFAADKCTSCGKCLAVCPGFHILNYKKETGAAGDNYYLGAFNHIYSGFSNGFLRRYNSSSGGLVSEVLLYVLENKLVDAAILTRFSSTSALRPEGFIARSKEDVLAAVGSKYSPVPLNILLKGLDYSKKYAYVGLPCHIQGLELFLRQHKKESFGNFIKLGLFCSRTNRLQATKLLLKYNRVPSDTVKDIHYRGSGHPGFFSAIDHSGKQKRIYHLDETYWGLLFKKYFVQYRCWLCPDKTAFYSDLSFGDDWSRSFYEDKVGTSVVIVRSEQGRKILRRMKENGKISLEEMDAEQLIRAQVLPYKMNILKREKIAAFFKQTVPRYVGFDFKKEKTSYWAELMMYFRIRIQESWFSRFMIRADLFLYRCWQRLKNMFNIRLFFTRLRLVLSKVLGGVGTLFQKGSDPPEAKVEPKETGASPTRIVETGVGKHATYRLVTVGGYGYNDVGDEAMPRAIIANLKERFENDLAVTMLSPDPAFTTAYHGNPSSKDIIFNYGADDIAGLNFERERYLRWAAVFAKNKIKTFYLTAANFRAPFFKLLRIIDKSHAVLNVGGGNLNSIMRKELYKRTTVHLIAKILGKKVYISGQTIGPFYHDNDRCIFLESLDSVDILTFRDKIKSRELVTSLGVSQPLMYDAGDDALTLKSIGKEAASKLIKNDSSAAWFALKTKHTWALNLKASLKMFKGAGRSTDLSNEINRLAAVGEYILSHYDARVLLVSTDYCAGVDDRVVLKEVYDNIPDSLKNRVNLLNNVYTDHELKGIISFCDFALGARYHFSVFALARFVPFIGLASGEYQRTKLKGILQLLDLEEYYIPEDMEYASLDNINGTIDKMVINEKVIREKLTKNVPLLMNESTKIVGHIYNDLTAAAT